MGRKLPADQVGVFPGNPNWNNRHLERQRVVSRMLAERAGLPRPEASPYANLGNRNLNAFYKREEVMRALRDNRIVAIEGETGSGKSTQLPQMALEMGYKKVYHLVPRRIMADGLTERLRDELVSQLGPDAAELVGVHHSERRELLDAPIVEMTPGTFLRTISQLDSLGDEPFLVIPDEIHEKDFETQMAMAVMAHRLDLGKNPNMRLAFVSATMDAKAVDDTYSALSNGYIPHIYLEGRPHELTWLEDEDEDEGEGEKVSELDPIEMYKKYGQDHERSIIFTAGKGEIRDMIDELSKIDGVLARPLHAKLPRSDVLKATHAELIPGQRLVIVATPAAQSGITIPGLSLAILDGTLRRLHLDQDGAQGLFKQYCAQNELIQMGGRAGRDVSGGIAVLAKSSDSRFGYKELESRIEQAPAQIETTNLASNVLLAASLDIDFFTINEYLMNKAERGRILDALEVLWRLQAIDEKNKITEIGSEIVKFPVRPELGRALVEAQRRGASGDRIRQLAAIVSTIEAGGLQYFERGAPEQWRKDIQEHANDDYIAQLDMFRATRKHFDGISANEHALLRRGYDPKNTEQAHQTYAKICNALGMEGHQQRIPVPSQDDIDELHDYLTAGLFDFAHTKKRDEKMKGKGVRSWYDEAFRTRQNERYLSDRSQMASPGPALALGMPRRFEKEQDGITEEHSVIEFVMPTSVAKLSKHVMHLTVQRDAQPVKLVNGRLQQRIGVYFGDIKVGEDEVKIQTTQTPEARKVLTEGIYEKPTQTISELVEIKRELERLRRRVKPQLLSKVFPNGVLTDEWLQAEVDKAITPEVDNIFALDNNLRAMVVREGISIHTWVTPEYEQLVHDNSPDYVELPNGVTYELFWTQGLPVINRFNLNDVDVLPEEGLFLTDGREVLFNHRNHNGDTKKMKTKELKRALTFEQ